MKKYLLKLLSIALLVLVGLVIVNCSKDQFVEDVNSNEFSSAEKILIGKIHHFHKTSTLQRDGVSLKSGNRISVDSAKYYIEATIKYTYCFPTSVYNQSIWDTTFISFPVDERDGDVLYDAAVTAYNNCVDSVRSRYIAISDTSKKLIGVLLQDMGTNASFRRDIRVIAQFGTGSSSLSLLDSNRDFDEEDEYYYVRSSYRCDGTLLGTGSPDIFENEIIHKYRPAPSPGYHVWFEPGEDYTPNYLEFSTGGTVNNYCDYEIFYANTEVNPINSETECLDYNQDNSGIHEMDFYLDGAENILVDWIEDVLLNPEGKSFETCSFIDFEFVGPQYREIRHILNYTFAIKHITPTGVGTGTFPIPIDD